MSNESKLWAADPHQFGPGKVHIVDDQNEGKTMCGRFLSAVPESWTGAKQATCKICLNNVAARPEREQRAREWEARRIDLERQRIEENERWQAWYQSYLRSPEWRDKRSKVMERAKGVCEGCLVARATEVHHTTYKHVGNEFLWELRAICRGCHESVTSLDRKENSN